MENAGWLLHGLVTSAGAMVASADGELHTPSRAVAGVTTTKKQLLGKEHV